VQVADLLRRLGGGILKIKLIVSGEEIFHKEYIPEGVSVTLEIQQTNERKYRVTFRKTFGSFRTRFAIWNTKAKAFYTEYENEHTLDADYERLDH
jgi:hypothetical protein